MKSSHSGPHPASCPACLTKAMADRTVAVDALDHIARNLVEFCRRHNVEIAKAKEALYFYD